MQARTASTHAHCNTKAALCAQGHENQFQPVRAQNLHTTNKVDECQLADCGSAWVCWRYGAVLSIYMCTFIVTQMWAEAEFIFIYLFISEVPMSKVLKPHMLTLWWASNLFRCVSCLHTSAAGVDSSTSPWPQEENSGQGGKKLIADSDNLQSFLNMSRRDFRGKKVTATCFLPFSWHKRRNISAVFVPVLLPCCQLTVPWEGARAPSSAGNDFTRDPQTEPGLYWPAG